MKSIFQLIIKYASLFLLYGIRSSMFEWLLCYWAGHFWAGGRGTFGLVGVALASKISLIGC